MSDYQETFKARKERLLQEYITNYGKNLEDRDFIASQVAEYGNYKIWASAADMTVDKNTVDLGFNAFYAYLKEKCFECDFKAAELNIAQVSYRDEKMLSLARSCILITSM